MERRTALLAKLKGLKYKKEILDAFSKVKREDFVLENWQDRSYEDEALPIVDGQTISQPSTIAYMLEKLELKKGQKILEIGAGSGYNAALISCIVGEKGRVYSIEYNQEVAKFAKKNIDNARIKNVTVVKGDGSLGYKKEKPYDGIIVTAACPSINDDWINQLSPIGIIVAPVGNLAIQKIVKMKRKDDVFEREESELDYAFVPLLGEKGF